MHIGVRLGLFVAVATLSAETTFSQSIASIQNDPVRDEPATIIRGRDGAAISAIGRYNIGLDRESARNPEKVTLALTEFISKNAPLFGLPTPNALQLGAKPPQAVDSKTFVLPVHQFVGQLRVLDSDLTAVFENNGALQSINGRIVPNKIATSSQTSSFQQVIAALQKATKSDRIGDVSAFEPRSRNLWVRKDGASIEAGWSRNLNRAVWKAYIPSEIVWLADDTNEVLLRQSLIRPGPTTRCDITHRDWPRATDGSATSINESEDRFRVSGITCEADQFWNDCRWRLQRQNFGFKHPIARIEDVDGEEAEDFQNCSSQQIPAFTNRVGNIREQGAFFVANQMRFFIDRNIWSHVSPNRDSNLDIHMDDKNVTVIYNNGEDAQPSAYFNQFWTEIRAHPSRGQQDVIMHEYGHYIVWTYDDLSSNCVQGEDEGSAVNETLAEIFSGFFARVNRKIDARYGAYSGTGTAPHTGPDTVLLHDVNCAGGDNYGHDLGGAFEQAVWELLFNRDCSIDACSRDTRTNGNRIWRRASRDDVQRHVGAALGYALKVLGQNVTHQQVAAQMLEKISSDSGRETKNRARAVFIHHGVL